MKNNIVNTIKNLLPYTNDSLINNQKISIPSDYDLIKERRYSFDIHGVYHSAYRSDCLLFVSSNIPFRPNQKRHIFADTLDNLVKTKEVYPFLLFLNGLFIKWSNIIIIKDCKYSYFMVLNCKVDKYDHACTLIPIDVSYEENSRNENLNTLFIFDKDGIMHNHISSDLGDKYTIINKKNMDFYYENIILTEGKIQKCKLPVVYKLHKENLMIFKNGALIDKKNLELHGLNTFSVNNNTFNNDVYVAKIFYYLDTNKSKDNIYKIKNQNKLIEEINSTNTVPEYMKKLNESFNFNYEDHVEYENNLMNSLNYIMKYNSDLIFDEVYSDDNKIVSRVYTGKEIKDKMANTGYVTMSRKSGDNLNNYPIMFVNGELYKYYNELVIINKNFSFPVYNNDSIKDDDLVEFVIFKNVDNSETEIVLYSAGNDVYLLNNELDLSNMKLFTIDPHTPEFHIEKHESIQYEIGFDWERIDNNMKTKLVPHDNFYYDKRLTLASKRQFRYTRYRVLEKNEVDIILPSTFKYCNNKLQYLVFVNGRKINSVNYKITIIKDTRPFDDISVYLNIKLKADDVVDIFYVPEEMEETYISADIPTSGTIIVDRTKFQYNLNKNLYLIFINGKKITKDQMYNIDSNKLKITVDTNSIKNLSILKYVKDDELLSTIFNENKDDITTILDTLNDDTINDLFGNANITDTENDILENVHDMKLIMYKLVKDYWLRPHINIGEEVMFDFDDEEFEKDADGNVLIPLDANDMRVID